MGASMTAAVVKKAGTSMTIDEPMQLRDDEFRLISGLVYERFGINLTDKKKALVRGRLHGLIRAQGFATFGEYYESVVGDETGGQLLTLVDRLSTNHSFFFREIEHFRFLTQTILPQITKDLTATGSKDIRIWSAGGAAGEEAYTLAMVMAEYFGSSLGQWDIGILATDISSTALSQARAGVYPAGRVNSVPAEYRKYLTAAGEDSISVTDDVKRMVTFGRLNLMQESYPFKGRFHVIFCRNVMIYFDRQTRADLVRKFHRYMHSGAYLLIGHSETLGRDSPMLTYVQPTIYRSRG